tara:strand:+ start:384 stop:560 length:177 start_codon:yes stop_codon:yes gene_type:complete
MKSNQDKILDLFEKESLSDKIVIFEKIRIGLDDALDEKQVQLTKELNDYQAIQESIKK